MDILSNEAGEAYSISSAERYTAVTPHDTNSIAKFKALYVGVTGNVKVGNADGDAVVFVGVPAGAILPIYGTRVYDTGTDATNIVALRDNV